MAGKRAAHTPYTPTLHLHSERDIVWHFGAFVVCGILLYCCDQVGLPFNDLMLLSILFTYHKIISRTIIINGSGPNSGREKTGPVVFPRVQIDILFHLLLLAYAIHMEIRFGEVLAVLAFWANYLPKDKPARKQKNRICWWENTIRAHIHTIEYVRIVFQQKYFRKLLIKKIIINVADKPNSIVWLWLSHLNYILLNHENPIKKKVLHIIF